MSNEFIFKLLNSPREGSRYPENFKWPDTVHHLLFDIGYSFACLSRVENLLKELALAAKAGRPINEMEEGEIEELVGVLESLRRGRVQSVNECYAAGEEAARRLGEGNVSP